MTKSFAAGETAHTSGVYKAIHANNHIPAHYIIARYGDTFPN
ncbi:MAG TPA: hypothetical protein VF011_21370 [Terriglobales bacterium]